MVKTDFIGKRKIWYLISLLVLLAGFISLGLQGLNYGIDFTGGNIMELQFEQDRTIEEVRLFLEEEDIGYNVQEAGQNRFIIRTEELSEELSSELMGGIESQLGTFETHRNEIVSSVIGQELTRNAYLALAIAAVLIIIYITYRFEFFFGLSALAALVHDVLITVGIFSMLRVEINSAFVAALLTIIGYSINDSIVIFDRIRENADRKLRITEEEMVNQSIRQSLFRSVATTVALMIVLFSLFFIGGVTIKDFVLAMIIGSASGAYSSIFIASPIWIDMKRWRKKSRSRSQHA